LAEVNEIHVPKKETVEPAITLRLSELKRSCLSVSQPAQSELVFEGRRRGGGAAAVAAAAATAAAAAAKSNLATAIECGDGVGGT
jgi:hypothetical protein